MTLAEGEPEEIAPRLRAGEFDLVLLFEFEGVGERLERRTAPLRAARRSARTWRCPPTTGWRSSKQPTLGDLREESWVQTSAPSPCARHVVRSCHAAGFEPRVSFESDDYQTVQGLVAAGVGVALIPSSPSPPVGRHRGPGARPRRARCRKVFAATPRGAAATPAVATMLDVLRGRGPTSRRD